MSDTPLPPDLPPDLRFLKFLVATLTGVMILGLLAIVALFVTRLGRAPLPELPGAISLPDGARPQAVTWTADMLIVVTDGGRVLVYDRAGRLRGEIEVQP
jgi:hypothetical protein